MTPALFAVAAALAGAASLFASRVWLRAGSYCCLVAALLALWYTALGHPRPTLFGTPKGQVISYALNEPHDIEVLVRPKHGGQPVLWSFDWNEGLASALQKASQKAQKAGRPMNIKGRGGNFADWLMNKHAPPVFYPAPEPQLPEKTRP